MKKVVNVDPNLLISNDRLTKKLNDILKELGYSKAKFAQECAKYNTLSKPTVLDLFNGKKTGFPSLSTLATVIKVCRASDNEKLKLISFDYLLNDDILDYEAKDQKLISDLGLSEDSLKRFRMLNHPLFGDNIDIVNYYLYHLPIKYWEYMKLLKNINECTIITGKMIKNKKSISVDKLKELLELMDNWKYDAELEDNYLNIKDIKKKLSNSIKKGINDNTIDNIKLLDKTFKMIIKYLKYELNSMNERVFDLMSEV